MARLPREFYLGNTVEIAKSLLGKFLVRRYEGELLAGRIVETEAYVGRCDRACHAYGYHRTPRNAPMFGPPGTAYLYRIYGMHTCLNLVTEPEGEPSAVLVRAVEPAAGIDTIRQLRFGPGDQPLTPYQTKNFLNGPGKLCKGFSLTIDLNGTDLTGDTLFVCEETTLFGGQAAQPVRERVAAGPRIGVDYAQEARDFPWRFRLLAE